MPNLEVTIFNQKLNLSYQQNEKERIIEAVEKLNKSWNKFSSLHGKVSDLKIVTLICLELQDSFGDYSDLKDKLNLEKLNVESLKKTILTKNKEFEGSLKSINKLELELDNKNQEISKIEDLLDDINDELLLVKNNILAKYNE
tara:strand:- start:27 stop:455 length:429 start_codon:yes stop_codon:yes gene_type:complete